MIATVRRKLKRWWWRKRLRPIRSGMDITSHEHWVTSNGLLDGSS